jgi:hypothetical protein
MTYGASTSAGRSLVIVLAALSVVVACNQGSPGEPSDTEQASARAGATAEHPDTLVDRWFKSFPSPGQRECGVTLRGGGDTSPQLTVERLHVVDFCVVSDTGAGALHVELTGPVGQERIDEWAGYFGDFVSPDVAPSPSAHLTG